MSRDPQAWEILFGQALKLIGEIAAREPEALNAASHFMLRHAGAILRQLDKRCEPLRMQFASVDALDFTPTFDDASDSLRATLLSIQNPHNDIG